MGALDGILVVALEQAVAAPFCTSRLADAGARVIKLERAEGDFARAYDHVVHGESAYFVWLNRGKESLKIDIKDPEDAALLSQILAVADVFIQNLAPGAAARAGFGSLDLRRKYPSLITCDISGYGEDGPYSEMKAYDFLIQCESGLASITGGPNEAGRVGVSVADICCGMNAHSAILEGLYAREKTGEGRSIALSLFDGIADWMAVPLLHFDYAGQAPKRGGLHHATIAPYGAYAAGDGPEVILAIQNEREWDSFCHMVLASPEIAIDPRFASNSCRCANRPALNAEIDKAFATMSAIHLVERLKSAGVAHATLNDVSGLSSHPQLRRIEVETPTGPARVPAPPALINGQVQAARTVPAVGAHTAAIRAEFGVAASGLLMPD